MDIFLFRTFFSNPPLLHPTPKKPQNLGFFKNLSSPSFFDLETWGFFYLLHIIALNKSTIRFIDFPSPKKKEVKNSQKFQFFLKFGDIFPWTFLHAAK